MFPLVWLVLTPALSVGAPAAAAPALHAAAPARLAPTLTPDPPGRPALVLAHAISGVAKCYVAPGLMNRVAAYHGVRRLPPGFSGYFSSPLLPHLNRTHPYYMRVRFAVGRGAALRYFTVTLLQGDVPQPYDLARQLRSGLVVEVAGELARVQGWLADGKTRATVLAIGQLAD